jgi:hypothetical protein
LHPYLFGLSGIMVTFNFTFDPGVTIQQALGFEIAGRIWSRHLSDPVTLNVHVGVSSNLPANVIGGALPGVLANASYGSVINSGLQQDQKSNDDQLAYQNAFNTGDKVTVGYVVPLIDRQQGVWSDATTMNMTRANAKAIGAIAATNTALDGAIAMGRLTGSAFHWNYDYTRSSTAPTGSLDFLSVAIHELGHIMGFISGVDLSGWNFTQFNSYSIPSDVQQHLQERTRYITPLDRLRYSTTSTLDTNDLSYGTRSGDKFFALGRGTTRLADFAMGKNASGAGDGYQASHWEERSTPVGIMDPALASRERGSVSNLDLRALDVIGWDLRNGLNASTLTTATLTTIRDQAVQALAQRLGRTTTWINSNITTSPSNLVRDRTADVDAMIQSSQIYEWGTTGSGSTSTGGRTWMEAFNQMALNQEVYVNYSTVSNVVPPSLRTNEPGRKASSGAENDPTEVRHDSLQGIVSATPSSDALLGIDPFAQLVGLPAAQAADLDNAALITVPVFDIISPGSKAGSQWSPIAAPTSDSTAASETSHLAHATSRQYPSSLFTPNLNLLLGLENNPLAQGALGASLSPSLV